MDNQLEQLLGSSFDCSCGKHHVVPTRYLVYDSHVYSAIPRIIKELCNGTKCVLIGDTRTYSVAGYDIEKSLATGGMTVIPFILPDDQKGTPEANDKYRDLILESTPQADLYIAVGSGVVNDLVKWTSWLRKTPYMVFATAASMNGYGSANVAATIDGLKVLLHAEAPLAVFSHPDVIINAPDELSMAGLGDVLAKSVSSADWKMNQLLFGEYYCQYSVDLLKELEPVYLDNPDRLKTREPASFEALFKALFLSSVAMTVTGTSAPASGGEHLISHTLDILAARDGRQHDLHGRQVGVSSILMAGVYARVMQERKPSFISPIPPVNTAFWGRLVEVVAPEYGKKYTRLQEAVKILSRPEKWVELQQLIEPDLVSPNRLQSCLKRAGAATSHREIRVNGQPLPRAVFSEVVRNANQMRARFTILDLALLLGIIPQETDAIIDQWVA